MLTMTSEACFKYPHLAFVLHHLTVNHALQLHQEIKLGQSSVEENQTHKLLLNQSPLS